MTLTSRKAATSKHLPTRCNWAHWTGKNAQGVWMKMRGQQANKIQTSSPVLHSSSCPKNPKGNQTTNNVKTNETSLRWSWSFGILHICATQGKKQGWQSSSQRQIYTWFFRARQSWSMNTFDCWIRRWTRPTFTKAQKVITQYNKDVFSCKNEERTIWMRQCTTK